MATEPPRTMTMKLPKWLWGGAVQQFLADALLTALHLATAVTKSWSRRGRSSASVAPGPIWSR